MTETAKHITNDHLIDYATVTIGETVGSLTREGIPPVLCLAGLLAASQRAAIEMLDDPSCRRLVLQWLHMISVGIGGRLEALRTAPESD